MPTKIGHNLWEPQFIATLFNYGHLKRYNGTYTSNPRPRGARSTQKQSHFIKVPWCTTIIIKAELAICSMSFFTNRFPSLRIFVDKKFGNQNKLGPILLYQSAQPTIQQTKIAITKI